MSAIPSWALEHLASALPGNPVLNGRVLSSRKVLANTRQGAVLVTRGLFGTVRHAFVEMAQDRIAFRCAGCSHNLQFYNLDLPATVYCSICAAKYHVDQAGQVEDAAGKKVESKATTADGRCACCADGCCEGGDCCDHSGCADCCAKTGCCKDGCDPATCCPDGTCQCCEQDAHGACCEQTGCCKDGCDPATCCPGETCACCTESKPAFDGGHAEPGRGHAHAEPALAAVTPPAAPAPHAANASTHGSYRLYRRDVDTKAGSRPLYFFSKGEPKSGEPSALPAGHEVGVNARTGLPFLRRAAGGATPAAMEETGPAKAAAAPAALHGYKGDSHPVIDVEGIGPKWAEALNACGVTSTDELCRTDAHALAVRMHEAVETIQFWQQMAELMKVKGIGPQYAEALVRSGVPSIDELKARKAADVVAATNTWLDAQKQTVIKTRLTAQRVQTWQKAAKAMRKAKQAAHTLS